MKVLVVGGAGYIGSHVAWELLKAGHTVDIFDREPGKVQGKIKEQVTVIDGNILDYPFLLRTLKATKYDCVIHLAALKAVGESMIHPEMYSTNNLTGTLNLMNAMRESGVKNIIFSSSAAVYGSPKVLPIKEDTPKNPENYYGFTKSMIEDCLSWYSRLTDLRFVALRYFNAAGYDTDGEVTMLEKNPANLIPAVMEAGFGMREQVSLFGSDYPTPDGTCVRDYIHVSDLATAHVKSMDYLLAGNESICLNLGTGKGLSVKEIFEKTTEVLGHEIPHVKAGRRAGDPAELYAESSLAQKLLGWTPVKSDLDTLIESTYTIYKLANEKKN